ncbi:MAG: hypothetical protein OEZ34_10805 [Spirochaetia bacterium]|nr:hypothetical protein [Spirochaetia bacterium]
MSVFSQTPGNPSIQSQNVIPMLEKHPTSRDPRYIPSILPPDLRKQLQPGEHSILSPTGEIDLESILMSQPKKKKDSRMQRYIEQRDEDLIRKNEYLFLEKQLAAQFGINSFPAGERREEYSETSWRRFQIIFFTSLPITLAISYGIISAAANTTVFTGPQTAGMAFMGLTSSGLIGWYDHVQWKKELRTSQIFLEERSENRFLAGKLRQKIESAHFEDIHFRNQNRNLIGFAFTLKIQPDVSP